METLKHALCASLVAFLLSGCLGGGPGTDTPAKQAVAFCNGYVGAIQRLTLYKQAGALTPSEISTIDGAARIVGAHCSQPLPPPPSAAVISALDQIILIQLTKRQ